jgi:hypothetical protein
MIKQISVNEYLCDECEATIRIGFGKEVIGEQGEGFHFCCFSCMNVFISKNIKVKE